MQTEVLNMAQQVMLKRVPETALSFRPFVEYLKERIGETDCHKSRYFKYVVEQFEKTPELLQAVDVTNIKNYTDQLQLIYGTVSPIIENEETHRWALSLPLRPVVFYSTNSYYNLVTSLATGNVRKSLADKDPDLLKKNQLEFTYSLILEKLYNFSSVFNRDMIHSLEDEKTGLTKYFRLALDTRFIEIKATRDLPELKLEDLHTGTGTVEESLYDLEQKLPLDMFRFEGFGVLTVTDVTVEQSIENIKNIILSDVLQEEENYYERVTQSLKSLIGHHDVAFGLIPVLQVNDKLIFNDTACTHSKLMIAAMESGMAETAYMNLADSYFRNPKQVFFRNVANEDFQSKPYLKMLAAKGIVSYALTPVYFNNSLAGVLEIFSHKPGILDERLLSKLEPAIPLIAQLLKNTIDQFSNSIDHVVKEKFTAVQPSVQWKFKEAAWHYIRDGNNQDSQKEIEDIIFDKVYPLYGSIDIRNSTVERNASTRADLSIQFNILLDVLNRLKETSGFGLLDEKIFLARKWLDRVNNTSGFNQEVRLNDFLDNNIYPFLLQFREGNTRLTPIIDEYLQAIDPDTGIATENRRMLEKSMNIIISSVNKYMEMMKGEIQQAYPSYFEKFRTDGVEYDIYIGQSIAPDKPFSDIYLKNLRLLQLTSMAAIARYSNALLPQLSKPVETTQLIFIHSQPIDIRFRKDEKRFDVEGSYNIRYHIVKKRIDKVFVKNTRERLTQPGKIALVYFSQKEADEYIGYIRYLQDQHVLTDDLEELDLEELQGISGLKALRVGVAID